MKNRITLEQAEKDLENLITVITLVVLSLWLFLII